LITGRDGDRVGTGGDEEGTGDEVEAVVGVGRELEAVGTTTVRAADAWPTPRPARSTTTKVMAATATTTASQPSTIPRSGRRPIPTPITLSLL
jgi:hypothetical protein